MRQTSQRTVLIIIVGAIASLLVALTSLLVSTLTGIISSLPLWMILVSIVVVIVLATAFGLWYERLKSTPETLAAVQENRQRMLQRVQTKWITGFLENDRYYDKELLLLPLCRCVGDRWDSELQDPLESAESLPLNTKISDVFNEADRRLLILGDTGSGKTTLLLELTRDLLKRAEHDEKYPIPVVLLLSSWATKQLSLKEWIVEELQSEKYQQVPRQIAQYWVENSQLLLLLDGLDEVAPDALPACIEAVNTYVAQANRSIAVCSRTEEYLKQGKRLSLRTVVSVQPLSFQKVEEYLSKQGKGASGLKNALEQEQGKILRELVTTPLFLKILILTYHGKSAEELLPLIETTSAKEQQHMLFHAYIERVLQKDGPHLHATAQQTKHWLAWLARQLTAHQQNELYLERLQPDWLPKGQRAFYRWSIGLLYGPNQKIEPVEALTWSRKGLLFGLVFGLFGRLASGLLGGLLGGLVFGLGATITTAALVDTARKPGGRKKIPSSSCVSPLRWSCTCLHEDRKSVHLMHGDAGRLVVRRPVILSARAVMR